MSGDDGGGIRLTLNDPREGEGRGPAPDDPFSPEAHREARREISSWPDYAATPLRRLPGLARRAGVRSVAYKDEARRFGLGSFKALGGAYGVLHVLREAVREARGVVPGSGELRGGAHREIVSRVTVTCATDGNHGRAVAWGAELFGCRAVIYIPHHVSEPRAAAIAGHGAEVIRVDGSYDDAVRRADADARREGRHVVSDTAYGEYRELPRRIMQGYTVLVAEALDALATDEAPTHAFVQGGVGGLAAAVVGQLRTAGCPGTRVVVVEPHAADCLYRSALAGEPVPAAGSLDTVMGCLSCAEVSREAWPTLRAGADAFLTIPDEAAVRAMRALAFPEGSDPPTVAGESGAAGTAGFLEAATDPGPRERLGLDGDARILLIGTEGANDPDRYAGLVGRSPEEVAGSGAGG